MRNTVLSIQGDAFLINGALTYSDIPGAPKGMQGLLMNARFIQGIFDDAADVSRFNRFGRTFDAEGNTDDLIAALPQWKAMGLRAITVGFQGGGPCFTVPNASIDNNPYSRDGQTLHTAYAARMDRIIRAADALGMVVIVSLFYAGQIDRLDGAKAVLNAVRAACGFLSDGGYTNIIVEIANEYDIPPFRNFPIIQTPQGMVSLIDLAQRCLPGIPVGASGGGGTVDREVVEASDVVLFHGNGQSRQQMVHCIEKARKWGAGKPIVCNEDSQALSNMQVCLDMGVSWGYYNNMTKQEPPTDFRILPGEDQFFAQRMAHALGIPAPAIEKEDQLMLVGAHDREAADGMHFLRVASLYPETIDYVDFYQDDQFIYRCYDDPHTLYFHSNWQQSGCEGPGSRYRAVIRFVDGTTAERSGAAS